MALQAQGADVLRGRIRPRLPPREQYDRRPRETFGNRRAGPNRETLSAVPRRADVSVAVRHAGNPHRNRRRCRGRAPVLFREYSPGRCASAILPRTKPNKTSARPLGTSRLHQRHRLRPLGPLGSACRSAQPPGMVLLVLMFLDYVVIDSSFQKIAKKEQDRAGAHLSLQARVLGEGCGHGCDSVYSAIARTLEIKGCARVEGR